MSGNLKFWNSGEALTTTELQRAADAAAAGDDLVARVLTPPAATGGGTYDKKVLPLITEDPTRRPRLLVEPFGVSGHVRVRPAHYQVGAPNVTTPNVADIQLAGDVLLDTEVAINFSNTSAQNRIDVVYALVQRAAVTASRKTKDVATGAVSTQTLTVAKNLQITFGIAQGTEGASPVAPTLPGDTASAWYFPLAEVLLTHPYVAGTALTGSQITQVWSAGRVAGDRVQLATPAEVMATSYAAPPANGRAATSLTNRFAMAVRRVAVVQHGGSSATPIALDHSIDWRYRMVSVRATKLGTVGPENAGLSPTPSAAFTAVSAPLFTAAAGTNFWAPSIGSGPAATPEFLVSAAGVLQVTFNYAPIGAQDVWYLDFEATEQFQG